MKLFFNLIIFSSLSTFSFGQTILNLYSYDQNPKDVTLIPKKWGNKFRDTLPSRIQYLDIKLTDLPIGNLNINYERSIKTKHSVEVGAGLKLRISFEDGKITTIPNILPSSLQDHPFQLEYIGSNGYNFNLNYKRNISREEFRTYIGIGCFYRYYWFNNKLEDFSYSNSSQDLYWESVTQRIIGMQILFGHRILAKKIFFLDFFTAAGIKLIYRHQILSQEFTYHFGKALTYYYDPAKETYKQSLQPNFQIGIKAGFFRRR